MRIVVSGTHASGKSTLISDFVLRHPEFTVLPDPFELIDEAWDAPGAAMFAAQLRVAAGRLTAEDHGRWVIAERGPLDFLAYLMAVTDLGDDHGDALIETARAMTAHALRSVDLLVVLQLTSRDAIEVGAEEHPALRATVDGLILELVDDPDLIPASVAVVEITGDPSARLTTLEAAAGVPAASR